MRNFSSAYARPLDGGLLAAIHGVRWCRHCGTEATNCPTVEPDFGVRGTVVGTLPLAALSGDDVCHQAGLVQSRVARRCSAIARSKSPSLSSTEIEPRRQTSSSLTGRRVSSDRWIAEIALSEAMP